jgi:hypothetical protein
MDASGLVPLSPERLLRARLLDEFGSQDVILCTEALPPLPPA